MSETILDSIKKYKIKEIELLKKSTSINSLEKKAMEASKPLNFLKALRSKEKKAFGIIAEVKKASPSKGIIRQDFNVSELAQAYQKGGAACLSILTDFPSFKGKNEYIKEAKKKSTLPVLRKDFLYDPYQVVESRSIGADCILIIMATVTDNQAAEIECTALDWSMDVLIEVHNHEELNRALKLRSKLIGINNRNLKTFEIDLKITEELAPLIPSDYLIVSESGFYDLEDLNRMKQINVNSFLIGESLMRRKNVQRAIEDLLSKKWKI